MKIVSPMATGNGAYIIHKALEDKIVGYQVKSYPPKLTYVPFFLKKAVNTKNANLIHTTPDYACFFQHRTTPSIITFHNYILDPWMTPYSSLLQNIHYKTDLRLFTKLAVTKANVITAVSRFTAELARKDLPTNIPIKVIYNGVDHNFFRPTTPKKNYPKKIIKVLFCGNLTQRKGAQWLIPIANSLKPNIKIIYTAGLRTRNSLPSHPQLDCLGAIPHQAMPAIYQSVDILLFPTVREGYGLAAAEAMACGLPVVATDCSSLPELIDEGQGGFLCRMGNVSEFAEKIQLLADNPAQRYEMGEYNRSKIEERFTVDRMVRQYTELFEKTLENSKHFTKNS
ncbi:glycosyltransferase family 4 protein [Desulfobulbus rhabdoformis]|uniref:glycosyltransferase family 4 protein n=1 Tax=Desulfobulbus rhabdoformis TaxID=34032 RepID=UPI0019657E84|nr:glycosyltransferase family 4 protein [Desulfobulbus rhabdoformis]MBM9614398.1 glycosyltransferase family 4 protein [Desulfobulbus rhabdoformis]